MSVVQLGKLTVAIVEDTVDASERTSCGIGWEDADIPEGMFWIIERHGSMTNVPSDQKCIGVYLGKGLAGLANNLDIVALRQKPEFLANPHCTEV